MNPGTFGVFFFPFICLHRKTHSDPKAGCENPKMGLAFPLMEQSMHDFVVGRLDAARGRWPQIAEASGVPLRTLEKVARRETEDPRVGTIQRLFDYLSSEGPSQ